LPLLDVLPEHDSRHIVIAAGCSREIHEATKLQRLVAELGKHAYASDGQRHGCAGREDRGYPCQAPDGNLEIRTQSLLEAFVTPSQDDVERHYGARYAQ